ncbi:MULTISPECIES: H-NS histone family protein [Burkholderia]|uniref:H-NS histone family protein n=1 Tax=Burkholderia TaxID=32008 RepID=UPI000841646C|nr:MULTISPECIES: H-NS histone family protein [unclassified Burkholderia]AOK29062.1 hypothetical protein AQ611_06100 [Burkholderia sp. Bp7605]
MMIDPYEELLAKRAQLDAEIAAVRATRRRDITEQILKLMREYEISVQDLDDWLAAEESGDRRRRRVEPRYWDPKTGATWSGRGKRPRWMAGHDPEEFRLKTLAQQAGDAGGLGDADADADAADGPHDSTPEQEH